MNDVTQEQIDAVRDEMSGRKGIGDELDQIDEDIQDEMLRAIVVAAHTGE